MGVLGNNVRDACFLKRRRRDRRESLVATPRDPAGWAHHELALSPSAGIVHVLFGLCSNNPRVLRWDVYRASDGEFLW